MAARAQGHRAMFVLLVLFALTAAPATFAATASFRFTATTGSGSTSSNTIEAEPGDLVTARIHITPETAGVSNAIVSLDFDTTTTDGLDLVSANDLLDSSFQLNLDTGCASTQESVRGGAGSVLSCESVTLQDGPVAPASVDIAEIVFEVRPEIAASSSQLRVGFLRPGVDGIYDNDGSSVSPVFGIATVVPEPGIAALGIGVAALLLGARSKRGRGPA